EHVEKQRRTWSEGEHEGAAHGGPYQHGDVAADGVESDRAREMLRPDDVMDDELNRRRHDDAGHAMDHEERGGVPAPQGARLEELAAIEAVGESTRVDGEDEERNPVADDGEAAERRRVERLEDDPVAGDVLDALGRHADERQQEVVAVVPVVKGAELRSRGKLRGGRPAHAGDPTSFRYLENLQRRRSRSDASRAPATSASNFAHITEGCWRWYRAP